MTTWWFTWTMNKPISYELLLDLNVTDVKVDGSFQSREKKKERATNMQRVVRKWLSEAHPIGSRWGRRTLVRREWFPFWWKLFPSQSLKFTSEWKENYLKKEQTVYLQKIFLSMRGNFVLPSPLYWIIPCWKIKESKEFFCWQVMWLIHGGRRWCLPFGEILEKFGVDGK